MDVINLYSFQNANYSIWIMVVVNNDTPRWLSMKNEHLMLALRFLSRIQVKRMDVYIQPLIDELKQSWEGIHVYVVSRPILTERPFTLYVICAYTRPDYPRLGFFSSNHDD
jgi:hypothetical protein